MSHHRSPSPSPSPFSPPHHYPHHVFPYPHSHHQTPWIPFYIALGFLLLILSGFGISRWIRWASPAPMEPEAPLPAEEGTSASQAPAAAPAAVPFEIDG